MASSPISHSLPPPRHSDQLNLAHPFSPEQLQVFAAIIDTIFQPEPPHPQPSRPPADSVKHADQDRQLFSSSLSSLPDLDLNGLACWIAASLSPSSLARFRLGLNFLLSRPITCVLTGHFSTFVELPIQRREQILSHWATSPLALKRSLFSAFVTLPITQIYTRSRYIQNLLGYPAEGEPRIESDSGRRKPSYPFNFIQLNPLSPIDSPPVELLEADVVIIGSGAGGSVVSSLVAKAGYRTLVIEKGRFVPTDQITGSFDGFDDMLEGKGQMTTSDGKILLLAGSTFGGGTTINWSASLVPPFHVRNAWSQEHQLPYFTTNSFAEDLKAVTDRLGVSTQSIIHSKSNQMVLEACRKIGVHVDAIPQNTAGNVHDCGMCLRGCPFGEKQGAPQTWLKDCAAAGGQFIQNAHVERILFSDVANPARIYTDIQRSSPNSRRKFAVGVLVYDAQSGSRFVVRARRAAICSGGAINTPAVLLRSGVRLNGAVGKGLHIHPVTVVTGWFDASIKPWEGSIMTTISCEVENREGTHYGSKIEVCATAPSLYAGFFVPWRSSKTHKQYMSRYAQSFSLVILGRDRSSGRVGIDGSTGQPTVDYVLDPFDGDSLVEGMVMASRILVGAGAVEIATAQRTVESFRVNSQDEEGANEKFEDWLNKVRKAGMKSGWGSLGSAHQMSSCRMGPRPGGDSVVSEKGKVWGFEKLWIADGSTLPTATGVNPAITIMSVSHSIGKKLVDELKAGDQQAVFGENSSKL